MTHDSLPPKAEAKQLQPEFASGDTASLSATPEKLQFTKVVAGAAAEGSATTDSRAFRPTSASIEKFLSNEWISYGLSQDDLQKIAKSAEKGNDPQRAQVANYLRENFDDLRALSAHGDKRLTSEDLTLYSQMLKHSEKNVAGGKALDSGLQGVHYDHENQAGIMWKAGGILAGLVGSHKVFDMVAHNPATIASTLGHAFKHPVAYLGIKTAARVGINITGAYLGSQGGAMIDRGLQDGGVRKHFVDQAEPAMKRLFKA
jgi:hypothetical protein